MSQSSPSQANGSAAIYSILNLDPNLPPKPQRLGCLYVGLYYVEDSFERADVLHISYYVLRANSDDALCKVFHDIFL